MTLSKTDLYQLESRSSGVELAANLMESIMKGDESAFRLFRNATSGLLFAILLHVLSHTQIAEEVLSEVYDEVKRKAVRFRRRKEQCLAWLILIAHRRAVERLYRQRNAQNASQKGNSTNAVTLTDFINITEQKRLIRTTLNSIPRLHREMMELAFFSGMSTFEIAKELGESCEVVDDALRSGTTRFFCVFKSLRF